MKINRDCSSLCIHSFYKIIETKDLNYLIEGYTGKKFKRTKKLFQELATTWEEILFEYAELTFNKTIISNYKSQLILLKMQFQYNYITNCLKLYEKYEEKEVLKLLGSVKKPINLDKEIQPQIDSLLKFLKGLDMKIKIARSKVDKIKKDEEQEIKTNLEKEALILEVNLGLKSSIEVRTTSVKRWLMMLELNKEKTKRYG